MLRSLKLACKSFVNHIILENMVKKLTCFNNTAKPTCIDLIITNKPGMFQNAKTYETGLSDFHKLVASTMKLSYKKRLPRMIKSRDYKNFSNEHFEISLYEKLANNTKLHFDLKKQWFWRNSSESIIFSGTI